MTQAKHCADAIAPTRVEHLSTKPLTSVLQVHRQRDPGWIAARDRLSRLLNEWALRQVHNLQRHSREITGRPFTLIYGDRRRLRVPEASSQPECGMQSQGWEQVDAGHGRHQSTRHVQRTMDLISHQVHHHRVTVITSELPGDPQSHTRMLSAEVLRSLIQ